MRRPEGGLDAAAGSGTTEREEDASWDYGLATSGSKAAANQSGTQRARGAG